MIEHPLVPVIRYYCLMAAVMALCCLCPQVGLGFCPLLFMPPVFQVCIGCPSLCSDCSSTVSVTLGGITNGSCTDCSNANATYSISVTACVNNLSDLVSPPQICAGAHSIILHLDYLDNVDFAGDIEAKVLYADGGFGTTYFAYDLGSHASLVVCKVSAASFTRFSSTSTQCNTTAATCVVTG